MSFPRVSFLLVLLLASLSAFAEQRFPPPDFEGGYKQPPLVLQEHRTGVWEYVDAAALLAAMGAGAWLLHARRSREGIFVLGVISLLYFGFYKRGCICPIGSTQNVALALADPAYPASIPTIAVFILPLVFALLYGRVFCGGVCALGAIQDLFLYRPLRVPMWLESSLGLLRYLYLGLAVYFVAVYKRFIICEYDPFVSLFRFNGQLWKIGLGAGFLLAGLFIARPYCRYLCPYGGLLGIFSRWSGATVRITPSQCTNCTLCDASCPFAAIERPRERPQLSGQWRLLMALAAVLSVAVLSGAGYWLVGQTLGGLLLGLWFGGVLAAMFLTMAFPGARRAFEAEKGKCLSCARCYKWCPYERERLEEGGV